MGAPIDVLRNRKAAAVAAIAVTPTVTAPTGTAASRSIALPSYSAGDTLVVFISTAGSNTLATSSTGWGGVDLNKTSSGATQPTTLTLIVYQNAPAGVSLTVTGFPASRHTQAVYVIAGGGVIDPTPGDGLKSDAGGAASISFASVNGFSAASTQIILTAASCGGATLTPAPTGFTGASDISQANANLLTARDQRTVTSSTVVAPSSIAPNHASSRFASITLPIKVP